MKKLLAPLLISLLIAASSAHAQFSKSTLTSQVNQQFPDNQTGTITPSILRSFFQNSFIPSFQQYTGVNPQVGTSYTVALSDYGQLITFSNASPVAVTLPQSIAPFNSFNVFLRNNGVGSVTVTAQGGSLISGAANLTLGAGASYQIISDGTNYQIFGGTPVSTLSLVYVNLQAAAGGL